MIALSHREFVYSKVQFKIKSPTMAPHLQPVRSATSTSTISKTDDGETFNFVVVNVVLVSGWLAGWPNGWTGGGGGSAVAAGD